MLHTAIGTIDKHRRFKQERRYRVMRIAKADMALHRHTRTWIDRGQCRITPSRSHILQGIVAAACGIENHQYCEGILVNSIPKTATVVAAIVARPGWDIRNIRPTGRKLCAVRCFGIATVYYIQSRGGGCAVFAVGVDVDIYLQAVFANGIIIDIGAPNW